MIVKISPFLLVFFFLNLIPFTLHSQDTEINIEMVKVEGGTFTLGCTEDQGEGCKYEVYKNVTISDFYIGKYEVTQAQWKMVMGRNPSFFLGCPDCPVEMVSWEAAQEFIQKLNELTKNTYRLPTVAEWEVAARGGLLSKGYKYAGSNEVNEVAWIDVNSDGKTHEVGRKKPNELGIYDMSGNVMEWCSDWYGEYNPSNQTNPQGPSDGRYKLICGGGWRSKGHYCKSTNRTFNALPNYGNYYGLRLVRIL